MEATRQAQAGFRQSSMGSMLTPASGATSPSGADAAAAAATPSDAGVMSSPDATCSSLAAPPTYPAWAPASQAKPARIVPLTPERYRVQVTIDREAHDLLRQAQDLMRHITPNGDLSLILTRALRLLVADLLSKKAAVTANPRTPRQNDGSARAIPAAVKRIVWLRDRGRCAFVGSRGRCGARGFLEYHHIVPYARGGKATVNNIEMRCRAHNGYEAKLAGLALGAGP
jgi:hypothetical protein